MKMLRHPWAPAIICLVALIRFAAGRGTMDGQDIDRQSERIEATAQSLAVLGGLTVGDDLMGWVVEKIQGPSDGAIRVWVKRGEVLWAIDLLRTGRGPGNAARSTKKYDLYYGHMSPGAKVDQAETFAVLDAVAQRIARVEDHTPVPAGM